MNVDLIKRLLKMSRDEYNFQQDCGTLWTFFPETTGDYNEDMKFLQEKLDGLGTRKTKKNV